MSNIPSSKKYVQLEGVLDRKPVSQDLLQTIGGSINYILDAVDAFGFRSDLFLTNGTWTSPANATKIVLFGCGGGGGGSGAASGIGYGGLNAFSNIQILSITPSTVYTILVGSGGTATTPPGSLSRSGGKGGSTLFKVGSTVLSEYIGGDGGGELNSYSSPPLDSANYKKGFSIYATATGGCAGPFGNGGNANYVGAPGGIDAPANSGAGGGGTKVAGFSSGVGGSGRLYVIYF